MVQTKKPNSIKRIFCIFVFFALWRPWPVEDALHTQPVRTWGGALRTWLVRIFENAENARNARNAICGSVSMIEHKLHIWHMSDPLHWCEQFRASDLSTAMEILDRWEAISSLRCSNEQGASAFQGLRRCWSYVPMLLRIGQGILDSHWFPSSAAPTHLWSDPLLIHTGSESLHVKWK